MKMKKSLLAALFVSTLAFTSVACDDDPTPVRDAATDRTPDTTPATDGGLDRTPDTTVTEAGVDRTPDTTTTDTSVDRAPDTTPDVAVDTTPADTSVDRAPDTTPDVAVDTAPDTTPDTGADGPVAVNGCVTFVDRTGPAVDTTLTWDQTIAADPERCMKVKVGYFVCWNSSSFVTHPLAPSGGDTPNPIMSRSAGSSACFQFTAPGTFGYRCTVHATMIGAIQVVP